MFLLIMMKKRLLKNIAVSRHTLQKKHILVMNKIAKSAKNDILFMTKTAEKPYPLRPHILI